MRCIAIDDEPLALEIIRTFSARRGGMELTTFADPVEGMKAVAAQEPDLLLLDIEMGDVSGVELARRRPPHTMLIFTTAYAEYALDGYELGAIDYLHKPFAYTRFAAAINKAEHMLQLTSATSAPAQGQHLTVRVDYRTVNLDLRQLRYAEAMDNYVRLYLAGTPTPLVTQMSMKSLVEQLPVQMFVRIHKSYIVSLHHIESYTHGDVTVAGCSRPLPIGRTYLPQFLEAVTKPRSCGEPAN